MLICKMNVKSTLKVICLAFLTSLAAASHSEECKSHLVETIPQHLTYNETVISKDTHDELLALINSATHSIDIASFYWTLVSPMREKVSLGRLLVDYDRLDAL